MNNIKSIIRVRPTTSIEDIEAMLQESKDIDEKNFGIPVRMNPIEELDYESWQVIVAVVDKQIVLILTDKYNQGHRYQTDPDRIPFFQKTIPFELFQKKLIDEYKHKSSLQKVA